MKRRYSALTNSINQFMQSPHFTQDSRELAAFIITWEMESYMVRKSHLKKYQITLHFSIFVKGAFCNEIQLELLD